MARKKSAPPSGPSNAYLISFGDTMTALLAFFIVLNSLAQEQTGINIHEGTGSFIRAIGSFGVPGFFQGERSEQAMQLEEWSPLYLTPSDGATTDEAGPGPGDDEADRTRVVDFELESFHRFVAELSRTLDASRQPDIVGEVSFDNLEHLPSEGPLLSRALQETLRQAAPQLRHPTTRVEIVVWATSAAPSAWERAVRQSVQLRQEAIQFLKLDAAAAARVTSSARVWISSTVTRPGTSIVLRRVTLKQLGTR